MTKNITFRPDEVSGATREAIERAIAALRAGDLIIYPTETFYGIGADPFAAGALDKLFALKGREAAKTVALIADDAAAAFALAREVPESARTLAAAFWPGPLTLVMPARADLPVALAGPDGGVGVRVSSHPIARAIAAGLGRPITATSANLAGEPPAPTLAAVREAFGEKVKVILDGGTLAGGAPSTLVACDRTGWRILRAGAIDDAAIAAACSRAAAR
ncbi:MAG: threonylcarbamoyl-AMP synthase [Candidatus Binataceae bacterium]|nr:threonylcarbamoyl-AMP synthase [Candidatus Binataceae bacterium]